MHSPIIIIARYFIVLPLLISAGVWWRMDAANKKRALLGGLLAAVIAVIAAKLSTTFVHSPRPFMSDHVQAYFSSAHDNGFPSDHTLLAATTGFMVAYFSRRWGLVCLVLAVLIGVARVIAGVHHGIDIVGGLALGGLAAAAGYSGSGLLEHRLRARNKNAN